MRPIVSVITPTKNRYSLLCQAIDSVQSQTLADWEHIIVDDGSDDSTVEEVERRAATDSRVRYFARTGEKGGANTCRNQGLAVARAPLIVFLDSDDLLAPHCLQRRVEVMERNADIDFAVFRTAFFEEIPGDLGKQSDSDLLGDDLVRFLCFELPWIISGPIWRKFAVERIGAFDEELMSWQDVDLHVRALAAGLNYVRFSTVDHYVRWAYEPTKVSVQQRRTPEHLLAAQELMVKFENVVRHGPGMTWVRQRALCGLYFFISERWIDSGRPRAALACWRQARQRALASAGFYVSGIAMLLGYAIGPLGRRLSHKWKGWARFRVNPEIVAS